MNALRKFLSMLVIGLISCEVSLQAQDDSGRTAPPSRPLVNPVPNPGKWTVTYSYPDERAPVGGGAQPASGTALNGRIRAVTVTRVKDITHVEFTLIHEDNQENWRVGTTVYGKASGTSIYVQAPLSDGKGPTASKDDPSKLDYSTQSAQDPAPLTATNDFKGMDWINLKNYVGTIPFAGRKCLVFVPQDTSGPKASGPDATTNLIQTAAQVALIDAETRNPVEVHSYGVYSSYKFLSAPDSLTLPNDLEGELKKAQARFQFEHQAAPRPY